MEAGLIDGGHGIHIKIEEITEDLVDAGGDAVGSGGSHGENGFRVFHDEDGSQSAAGTFASLGRVNVFFRAKTKVGEAVIQEDACARGDNGCTPVEAEGLGGADDVACLIDDDEVGGLAVAGIIFRWGGGRCGGSGFVNAPDQFSQAGGGEDFGDAIGHVGGITEIGGDEEEDFLPRVADSLDARQTHRWDLFPRIGFEGFQGEENGGTARDGWSGGVDAVFLILLDERRIFPHPIFCKILFREPSPSSLGGADQLVSDFSVVKGVGSIFSDFFQGVGEIRIFEDLIFFGNFAVGIVDFACDGILGDELVRFGELYDLLVGQGKAVAGGGDGGGGYLFPRELAPLFVEEIEGGGAPRDAGATVATGPLGGGFFSKFVERDGGGGLIKGFEVGDFSGGGVVVEGGEFSAESGVEGFGHAESEGDGGGGIGGVASLLKDFDASLGGLFTARNNYSCGGVRLHGGG